MSEALTAHEAVAKMLWGAPVLYTGDTTPRGCLLARAAATGSADGADVRAAVAAERHGVRDIVIRRIEADISRELLSADTPATVLADLATAGWAIYEG